MEKIKISIGICAYNEEKNIEYLLNSLKKQETDRVDIEEIIIVSDGSIDKTDEIVKKFSKRDNKVKLIKLEKRSGKYIAINEFLRLAKNHVLVLCSADVILDKYAIESLCFPFLRDENLGVTTGRPKPKNSKGPFLRYVVNLQWHLHHRLSLIKPKFGELIAFRNIVNKLAATFVDEEQIASSIKAKGYRLKYIPDAVAYNKGPDNIRDFIIQRRRINAGHLMLKRKYNYEVITLDTMMILRVILSEFSLDYVRNIHWFLGGFFLELVCRFLAKMDIIFRRWQQHYKWKFAGSTKSLN